MNITDDYGRPIAPFNEGNLQLLSRALEATDKLEKYWKQRCLLAEKCLKESPCDPDITSEQIKAHAEYDKFIQENGEV